MNLNETWNLNEQTNNGINDLRMKLIVNVNEFLTYEHHNGPRTNGSLMHHGPMNPPQENGSMHYEFKPNEAP